MHEQNSGRKRQIITTLAVLIVIVAIVAGVSAAAGKKGSDVNTTATTTAPTTASSSDASSASPASYKDGTYPASGEYSTPGGANAMDLSVTIKGGVVTATSATTESEDHESRQFDDNFLSVYKQQVVGKNVSSLNLNRIAGSSLTTDGFNSALQQIESEATA